MAWLLEIVLCEIRAEVGWVDADVGVVAAGGVAESGTGGQQIVELAVGIPDEGLIQGGRIIVGCSQEGVRACAR